MQHSPYSGIVSVPSFISYAFKEIISTTASFPQPGFPIWHSFQLDEMEILTWKTVSLLACPNSYRNEQSGAGVLGWKEFSNGD